MVQLTQTALLAGQDEIRRLAEEFVGTGCAFLPGFLVPQILQPLMAWTDSSQFVLRDEVSRGAKVFGTTLKVSPTERSLFLLHFALNRPALFQFAQNAAGCPEIANFTGRLHRTVAGAGQHIDWHEDDAYDRTLGLCINLSSERHSGGVFQMRDAGRIIRAEIAQWVPGDAFLFRIGGGWQHRLTLVDSGSRTVGVGWFCTRPDWREYALTPARCQLLAATAEKGF